MFGRQKICLSRKTGYRYRIFGTVAFYNSKRFIGQCKKEPCLHTYVAFYYIQYSAGYSVVIIGTGTLQIPDIKKTGLSGRISGENIHMRATFFHRLSEGPFQIGPAPYFNVKEIISLDANSTRGQDSVNRRIR